MALLKTHLPFRAESRRSRRPRSKSWSIETASLVLLPLILFLGVVAPALAQTLSESQVKAAYLFDFTRFISWPDSAFASPTSAFAICIAGDTPITALLSQATSGKAVSGRPISVRRIKRNEADRSCHVVFISVDEQRDSAAILRALQGAHTLTVAEFDGFSASGGMINFFLQDSKVKFELNLAAATTAGLDVSSKLIVVSRRYPPDGR